MQFGTISRSPQNNSVQICRKNPGPRPRVTIADDLHTGEWSFHWRKCVSGTPIGLVVCNQEILSPPHCHDVCTCYCVNCWTDSRYHHSPRVSSSPMGPSWQTDTQLWFYRPGFVQPKKKSAYPNHSLCGVLSQDKRSALRAVFVLKAKPSWVKLKSWLIPSAKTPRGYYFPPDSGSEV